MRPGYLALETYPEKPGLVGLLMSEGDPHEAPQNSAAKIRFVLHFEDIDTAFMHAQSRMSHHIEDLNNNLYKRHLALAIGDLETVELNHTPVWRDPDLSKAELEEMADEIKHNQKMLSMRDKFVQFIKWAAILFLLLNFLSPLISEILNKYR